VEKKWWGEIVGKRKECKCHFNEPNWETPRDQGMSQKCLGEILARSILGTSNRGGSGFRAVRRCARSSEKRGQKKKTKKGYPERGDREGK